MATHAVSLADRAPSEVPRPIQAPNNPFVCAFHRENWCVRKDGRVVPALLPIPMAPGMNGIGERQRAAPHQMWDTIVAQSRGRDRVLLHPNARPEGCSHAVVGTEVRDPVNRGQTGIFYHMAWETPRPSTTVVDVDCELWDRYLARWAEDGLPLRPDADVIDARVAELSRRHDRALGSDGRETTRSKAIKRELDAWVALQSPAAPAMETGSDPKMELPPVRGTPVKPSRRKTVGLDDAPPAEEPVNAAGDGFVKQEG